MLLGAHAYFWHKGEWLKQTANPADGPVLGEYDNTWASPVMPWHMEQVKHAGIDFLAVSWSRQDDVEHAFEAASKAGVMVTAHYESLTRAVTKKGAITEADMPAVLDDLCRLARDAQDYDDAWLRVDDKPAFMIYVTRCYESTSMIDRIRDTLSDKMGEDVFLVGDELFWREAQPERLMALDAATAYNMYKPGKFDPANPGPTFLDASRAMMLSHKAACEKAGIALWGSALPGYDDSGYRPQEKHVPLPRMDGDFFKRSLEDASWVAIGEQKVVVVTSYSEWFEGSQIEPATSYGNLYLDILREFKGNRGVFEPRAFA